jgi:chorismate mutase/prephenate dehydratase
MTASEIDRLRERIDDLDRMIVSLLAQRAQCALQAAEVKAGQGRSVFDPERERQVLARVGEIKADPLPPEAVKRIYREVVSACRGVQTPLKAAFLGPEGAFSHAAALARFGGSTIFRPQASIAQVFADVEAGRSEYGVVPVENSLNGAVDPTLDEWLQSDLKIRDEVLLPVELAVLSKETELGGVSRVYSHPQALAQCRDWLAANLPGAELAEAASTSAAARRVADEPKAAAVGSTVLAERYGLHVLAEHIQDRANNQTRFFVIGRQDAPATGRDKTSVLFSTAHCPGALQTALAPLAEAGVNLTRIESRPTREKAWEYVFFIDLEGHRTEDRVDRALDGLAKTARRYKLLGSYPAAEEQGGQSEPDQKRPLLTRIR